MKTGIRKSIIYLLLAWTTLLGGCVSQQTRTKSSVLGYLYPNKSMTVVQPSVPTLEIPISVGIAFVPEQSPASRRADVWTGNAEVGSLTEAEKTDILDKVAENFRKYEFVGEIVVIPSEYLTEGGGFRNLDQIRTMYGTDVMALVSYDQVQFTDEGLLSISYWTLVGAYVFAGEKNDTSTLIDTTVYDIESRKLLFRAPGTSKVKGRATPVNQSEELRVDSVKGFKIAADKMTTNLDMELARYRDKIRLQPDKVHIVQREGYSGGGVFGGMELLLILMALGLFRLKPGKSC